MRYLYRLAIVVSAVLMASPAAMALVMTAEKGHWPSTWPAELEPYRAQAKTVAVAHGIQETVYEIPFKSFDEFARAWPHLLKVKSKGASLTLENCPSTYHVSGSTMKKPGVRVISHCGATASVPGGPHLFARPPWPESLLSASGELPEYVAIEHDHWTAYTESDAVGFRYRARVDIVLVVDGKVVDLNRIALPPDTPIVDNRTFTSSAQ